MSEKHNHKFLFLKFLVVYTTKRTCKSPFGRRLIALAFAQKKSIPDMALWLVDFSKYNFFPMSKDKAKTFQTERKDRYGDINRKIILVIHYTIEDFSSAKYKGIQKSFANSGYTPVVANISSVEIYDEKNKKIGDLIQK